jgi:hypothetical protein
MKIVVKTAERSHHPSQKRPIDFNLSGKRTFIVPLNLAHQNSLYFMRDANEQEKKEAATRSPSPYSNNSKGENS